MVKAGTKQVVRWEKWVAEYRRWVGSGLTQRSYCGQVGLMFTQFKAGVEAARQQWVRGSLTLVALELAERIAIESTGHRTPNYPNLTDSALFFASGGRDVVRGSLTISRTNCGFHYVFKVKD